MVIISMAGVLMGRGRDQVVRCDEETGEVEQTVTVRGRWLYVRKCRREEMAEGIVLPDTFRDNTAFCLVLAVGSGCGKNEKDTLRHRPETLAMKRKQRDWVPCVNTDDIQPGTTVCLFPDDHESGIMRSPYDHDEYFIDETIAKCMIS